MYMTYVIHAIMFILTDGNQIQIGFGFLKVNILIMLRLVALTMFYLIGT